MTNKIHKCITLDVDIVQLGEARGINFSNIINTYLKEYFMVDVEKLPKEKDLIIKELAENKVKTDLLNVNLKKIKDKERKVLEEKLAKQRKREEDIRTGRIEILD